jgi:uncharacterized protein YchJ
LRTIGPRIAVFEKEGAYYKLKFKDGVPTSVKLSNFTVRLRNIFIQGQSREREVIFVREDGRWYYVDGDML